MKISEDKTTPIHSCTFFLLVGDWVFLYWRSPEPLTSVHYSPSATYKVNNVVSTTSSAHLITRVNQGTLSQGLTAGANGSRGTLTIYTR